MMEYERLTRRNKDGTTWVKCAVCDIQDKCDFTKECCCQALQDRLAELEDKIEQGTLKEIPENAVVLTREEYEVLKIKKQEKHWLETCLFVWGNEEIDARKKTAEKFANKAKQAFYGVNCIDIDEWNWYLDTLDEIAKEIIGERE